MRWRWPWKRKAKIAAEESQAAAVRVRAEVILPLRQLASDIDGMRLFDGLPDAIKKDMRRQQREFREGPGADPGAGNPDRG